MKRACALVPCHTGGNGRGSRLRRAKDAERAKRLACARASVRSTRRLTGRRRSVQSCAETRPQTCRTQARETLCHCRPCQPRTAADRYSRSYDHSRLLARRGLAGPRRSRHHRYGAADAGTAARGAQRGWWPTGRSGLDPASGLAALRAGRCVARRQLEPPNSLTSSSPTSSVQVRRAGQWAAAAAVLTIGLIAYGSWVRATGSGLGCPDWPLCEGVVVPELEGATAIEFGHRVYAGVTMLAVVVASWYAIRGRTVRSADRQADQWCPRRYSHSRPYWAGSPYSPNCTAWSGWPI